MFYSKARSLRTLKNFSLKAVVVKEIFNHLARNRSLLKSGHAGYASFPFLLCEPSKHLRHVHYCMYKASIHYLCAKYRWEHCVIKVLIGVKINALVSAVTKKCCNSFCIKSHLFFSNYAEAALFWFHNSKNKLEISSLLNISLLYQLPNKIKVKLDLFSASWFTFTMWAVKIATPERN